MKKLLIPVLASALPFAACGADEPKTRSPAAPPATQPVDDHHGEPHALGDVTVGAHTFRVVRHGDVEPGHDLALSLEVAGTGPLPETVRAWIGVESGQGSMKARLAKEERSLHEHVEVPKSIPVGSRLWIEVEQGTEKVRGSIAYE